MPRPGDLVWIGRAANRRIVSGNHIAVRVVRIVPHSVISGVAWMHGYELGRGGYAVRKRTIPVRTTGLIFIWKGRND